MRNRHTQRGNVILMVVALLSIIALLGLTFLIVTQLYRKQSTSIVAQNQIKPAAGGVVEMLRSELARDLYMDNNVGPYGDMGSADTWEKYVDFPSEDYDRHLATDKLDNNRWYHLSNLVDMSAGDVNDVPVTAVDLVDTDADGDADARAFPLGFTDLNGNEYFAAVRLTDTAARINVNTAGKNNASPSLRFRGPANVRLEWFVGGDMYEDIHVGRCFNDTTPPDLAVYATECGRRMLDPQGNNKYLPFGVADEIGCRYFDDELPAVTRGRLNKLANPSVFHSSRLTTYSVTRKRFRDPKTGAAGFAVPLEIGNLDDADVRKDVYDRMLAFISDMKLWEGKKAEVRKLAAAHFVANLWAYTSPTEAPWKFEAEAGVPEVYGLQQDLVISEAYAKHDVADFADDDYAMGYAIEILNPTDDTISLADYKLTISDDKGNSDALTLPGSIPAGQRKVFYDFDKGANSTAEGDTFMGGGNAAGWSTVNGIYFRDNAKITLVREYGAEQVPIDQVRATDLGYVFDSANPPLGADEADARRDDVAERARYNVAAYKVFTKKGHRLNKTNQLDVKDIASANYPVPIYQAGEPLKAIGQVGEIYLTGHTVDGTTLTPFSLAIFDGDFQSEFGDGPARGRLNPHPDSVSSGGWAAGKFPDVPLAAIFSEYFTLLPGDPTRPDDPTRVYGMININTASDYVLAALPFQSDGDTATVRFSGKDINLNLGDAVRYILRYRHGLKPEGPVTHDYSDRAAASGITNLRSTAPDRNGYLSPGEVAVPLGDYVNNTLAQEVFEKDWNSLSATEKAQIMRHVDYLRARDSLYRAVSSAVAVRSDAYAANILIFKMVENKPVRAGSYLVVLDRSNCTKPGQMPAVLLFDQID